MNPQFICRANGVSQYAYPTQPPADPGFNWHSMFGTGISIGEIIGVIVCLIILAYVWGLFLGPRWEVWRASQEGLADLAEAKNEQQVQVAKAQGRLDAAQLNKQAAIVEAEAVSEQILRIGTQLTAHDLYLRWQWIKMMEENGSEAKVIYVPTEANLPILEAARLK